LIAVVGVALTMTRSYVRCFSVLNSLVSTEPSNVRVMGVRECLYACVPLLVLLSAVLLPLRLARPWRRFRRIARLPGLTVSYAAAVALVFALAWAGLDQRTRLWNTHFADIGVLTLGDTLVLRVIATKDMIGSAVAVTWLILWFGGGWRPEPTWIDRLGRFLGAFWVVFGVALWVDSVVRR
jgi:hypothetical protein